MELDTTDAAVLRFYASNGGARMLDDALLTPAMRSYLDGEVETLAVEPALEHLFEVAAAMVATSRGPAIAAWAMTASTSCRGSWSAAAMRSAP